MARGSPSNAAKKDNNNTSRGDDNCISSSGDDSMGSVVMGGSGDDGIGSIRASQMVARRQAAGGRDDALVVHETITLAVTKAMALQQQ